MSRRRRQAQALPLPWWVPVPAALVIAGTAWGLVPYLAARANLTEPLRSLVRGLLDAGVPSLAGWVGLSLCALASLRGLMRAGERSRLLARQRSLDTLRDMDWKEFERLVGEVFRRRGYRIVETGQGGADGGIDLILVRGAAKIIVQCKQWKTSSVGAKVVREMYGLMTHHRAERVVIVCVGKFTRDAWSFAQGKPIDLVGGQRLLEMILELQNDKKTTVDA